MTVEPTIPFPASPYCRVRARVASIWADGPDDGTHPDWRPAAGEKVTLTPSIGSQLLTYDVGGPDPIIVTVERVECVVDEDGWLAKADGRPVYIAPTDDPLLSAVGWTWTASIKGKSIAFAAPTGGVVNLAMFIAAPATDNTKTWVERIPELVALIEAGTDPAVLAAAVEAYLTANPPAAVADATTTTKGILQLTGDLGGTATAPTVPGLADKADADHGHAIGDVTGLQSALDGKQAAGSYAAASHNHDGTYAPVLGEDDNYVTDAEKAALHSHANKTALDNVSGVNTGDQDLSGYATTASLSTVATSGAYADLTGTPTIPDSPDDIGAAPAAHDHTAADIDSGAAIDGHVLTADGSGGAVWEAPPAGGGADFWNVPSLVGQPLPLGATNLNYASCTYPGNATLGYLTPSPIIAPEDCQFQDVSIYVSTAAEGSSVRVGLYSWYPSGSLTISKLVDIGTFDTSSTGLKTISLGSPFSLPRGRYLFISMNLGGTPTVYGFSDAIDLHTGPVLGGNKMAKVAGRYEYAPHGALMDAPTITLNLDHPSRNVRPNIQVVRSA